MGSSKEYARNYRKKNLEMMREYSRAYQAAHPDKMREYKKRYRKKHWARLIAEEREERKTPEYRKRHRDWQRKRQPQDRAKVRAVVRGLKNVPCADCKKSFPWYVMDFDHVRGRKVNNIGSMGNALTVNSILLEAKKCDVVCACCHRIRTYITRKKKH